MNASNLLKKCKCHEWRPLTLHGKFLTLDPKNYVTTLVFVRRIEGKIESKMVVPKVVGTGSTIKFCVKLGYEPTEMFNMLQRGGDAVEMKKKQQFLSGTHG